MTEVSIGVGKYGTDDDCDAAGDASVCAGDN